MVIWGEPLEPQPRFIPWMIQLIHNSTPPSTSRATLWLCVDVASERVRNKCSDPLNRQLLQLIRIRLPNEMFILLHFYSGLAHLNVTLVRLLLLTTSGPTTQPIRGPHWESHRGAEWLPRNTCTDMKVSGGRRRMAPLLSSWKETLDTLQTQEDSWSRNDDS